MSGIYIKGSKSLIPCCHCKQMTYNPELIWDDARGENGCVTVCLLTGELIDNTKQEKCCPLVIIPDHGRLIDADALPKPFYNGFEEDAFLVYDADDIKEAPTIIPADGVVKRKYE